MASKISKFKKKHFSSFDYMEAFKYLQIKNIEPLILDIKSVKPSDFFIEHLRRIAEVFDLQSCEESKKLIIDAICEEALQEFKHLKIWKGAPLADEYTSGYADYLLAERKAYLESPFLCIVEAKKDNFEQGLAQCLVEMKACQYNNFKHQHQIDVFGIVTNGDTWQFYRLTMANQVYGTDAFSRGTMDILLGCLQYLFQQCESNLLETLKLQY